MSRIPEQPLYKDRERQPEEARIDEIALALSKSSVWTIPSIDVDWIQTHISHVFLVGDRVFKLRKAVQLPFLDFSTRADRNADCLREIELNRRLAPTVYLGVAPVILRGADASIGPIGESIRDDAEHVVVMRRLPSGRDALSMLKAGRLTPEHLARVANLLTRFHASRGLGSPAPWSPKAWQDRIREPVVACLETLSGSNPDLKDRVESLWKRTTEVSNSLRSNFSARRVEGRAVDGHGDLHLDHIWFEEEDEKPIIIDCIEFNEELRTIDRASDVAFLTMDLRYRGRPDLAEYFLHAYASLSDDYGLFGVVDFYSAYRALVRAKVAALAALQSSITPTQRKDASSSVERHLELAESLLKPSQDASLIVLCGTVGSGKSSVARDLARTGRGIAISSDRVRKALAGISATTRPEAEVNGGIYGPEETERVYRALLERAGSVLDGGRTTILDASYSTRAHRDVVRQWASDRGIAVRLIEVCCEPEEAKRRLSERKRKDADPSDAGPDFLPISRARYEPPDEWPKGDRETIWSSRQPTVSR